MHCSRTFMQFGQQLALWAALFGGLFLGAGNMLMLHVDPAAAHRLHTEHGAAAPGIADRSRSAAVAHDPALEALICGDGLAAANAWPASEVALDHGYLTQPTRIATPWLPAHCLFCLDGIVPQPVALLTAPSSPADTPAAPATVRTIAVELPSRRYSTQPRAPPASMA